MPEAASFFWGIERADWLSAILTFLGIFAAILTSWWLSPMIADRQGRRGNQERVLRMLLVTRLTPGNAEYQAAIALIPIDFKDALPVMNALRDYIATVSTPVDQSNMDAVNAQKKAHDEHQHKLIVSIAASLGFPDITPEMLESVRYISMSYATREAALQTALESWPRIATALEQTNAINADFVARTLAAKQNE